MTSRVDFVGSVLFQAYAERIGKRSAEDLFLRVNYWQDLASQGIPLWEAYDAAFRNTRWDRSRLSGDGSRRQVGNRKRLGWIGR
jgi:hypothetical protein